MDKDRFKQFPKILYISPEDIICNLNKYQKILSNFWFIILIIIPLKRFALNLYIK